MEFKFLILPFLFLILGINAYPGCSSKFAETSCKSYFSTKWPLCESQRKIWERGISYTSALSAACVDGYRKYGEFNCEHIFDHDCHDYNFNPVNHRDYEKCVELVKKELSHSFDRSWNYVREKYICKN